MLKMSVVYGICLQQCIVSYTFIKGEGIRKAAKPLWQGAIFASIWCIWLKRNSRIFNNRTSSYSELWQKVNFLGSFWAKGHGFFSDIGITDLHQHRDIFIHGPNDFSTYCVSLLLFSTFFIVFLMPGVFTSFSVGRISLPPLLYFSF